MISLITSMPTLLVIIGHVIHLSEATCFTSSPNVILQNHVIFSLTLPHIGECWQTCKKDARCQSLNYFVKKLLCEINNRTIDLAPEHEVHVMYASYFDNPYRGCAKPVALGMESGAILDAQIKASSTFDERFIPSFGRLHNKRAWGSKDKLPEEWIQVDLGNVTKVTVIKTQGDPEHKKWVKTYSLKFSLDGLNFKDYEEGKIFPGNNDRNTVVKNDIYPAITARIVRVVVKSLHSYSGIRMELYGCN